MNGEGGTRLDDAAVSSGMPAGGSVSVDRWRVTVRLRALALAGLATASVFTLLQSGVPLVEADLGTVEHSWIVDSEENWNSGIHENTWWLDGRLELGYENTLLFEDFGPGFAGWDNWISVAGVATVDSDDLFVGDTTIDADYSKGRVRAPDNFVLPIMVEALARTSVPTIFEKEIMRFGILSGSASSPGNATVRFVEWESGPPEAPTEMLETQLPDETRSRVSGDEWDAGVWHIYKLVISPPSARLYVDNMLRFETSENVPTGDNMGFYVEGITFGSGISAWVRIDYVRVARRSTPTGRWVSQWHDWGGRTGFDNIRITASIEAGESVEALIEVSDDASAAKDSQLISVADGTNTYPLNLADARYTRVTFALETGNLENTPEVNSFTINANAVPVILGVSVSDSLIDRDIDWAGSGADDAVRVTVQVRDNNGVTDIDASSGICFITIYDPGGTTVVDNSDISASFSQVDENTAEWYYDFNPADNATVGGYDVYIEVYDENGAFDNIAESDVFTVDDLDVTVDLAPVTPEIGDNLTISGTVSRLHGGATGGIDNVRVIDSQKGELALGSQPDNTYSTTYAVDWEGLKTVAVYAARGTLDGGSTENYFVGDLAVDSQAEWDAGVHENTVAVGGVLALENENMSGSWASPWYDFGPDTQPENFGVSVSISSGENVLVIVETGENAGTVKDNTGWVSLTNGLNVIDLSSLSPARHVRVRFVLETDSAGTTPEVHSFAITVKEWTSAETWSGSCQASASWLVVGRWSGTVTAPIPAPILVSPENAVNVNNSQPTFQWDNSQPADNFWIQVDDDPHFSFPLIVDNTTGTNHYTPPTGLADDLYYWRVLMWRGGENSSWSENWIVRVDTIGPAQPTLVSPQNNESENDNTPVLDWDPPFENSLPLLYRVWISRYSTFIDTVRLTDWMENDNWEVSPPLEDNLYYWKVRGMDNAGNIGDWSTPRSFRVDTTPPEPSLISPTEGGWASATQNLDWSVDENSKPVLHYVEVHDTPDFSNLVRSSGWIPDDNWIISPALGEGTYYWYVKARDNAGNEGGWSENRSFVVDNTAPSQVQLLSPADGATFDTSSVALSWHDAEDGGSGIGSYELWVSGTTYQLTENSCSLSLSNGVHSWRVRAVDSVGNAGEWSGTRSFTVSAPVHEPSPEPGDTTPPTLEVLEPTDENVSENIEVKIKATDASGIDAGSITAKLDGEVVEHTWSDSVIIIILTNLEAGEHQLIVEVRDASSNRNKASLTIPLNVSLVEEAREKQVVRLGTLWATESKTAVFEIADVVEITVKIENLGENAAVENLELAVSVVENVYPSPPENVLVRSFLEISTTASPDVVAWVDIKFRVAKEWINVNDVGPLAVALYRLGENGWIELPTKKTDEDNTFVYYVGRTPGLSFFAIGIKTIFPTFELRLPQDPIEVKNGIVEILLWATNPTSNPVVKSLELKFDGHVRVFEVNVGAEENKLVKVYVKLGETASGTWEVELRDAETQTVLDRGEVTLLATTGLPSGVVAPPSWPLALMGFFAVVGVGLGSIYIWRRMKSKPITELLRPARKQVAKLGLAGVCEPAETSSLVQEYYDLLLPVARKALRKRFGRGGKRK